MPESDFFTFGSAANELVVTKSEMRKTKNFISNFQKNCCVNLIMNFEFLEVWFHDIFVSTYGFSTCMEAL